MVPAKARPGVTAALEARDAEDPYGALVDVKLAAGRPPRLQFGGANPAVVTVGGAPLLTAEDLARACAATLDAATERGAPGQLHRVSRVLHRGAVAALSLRVGRHVAGAAHRLSDGEALHEAMLRVLRNHTPAAIVVDELVDRAAALAAADVGKRASASRPHAWEKGATSARRGRHELADDAALAPVLGDFEIVTLSDREAARRAKTQRDPRKRRAASLAAARKEREAEDLDQRFREAALASGVKISPREKILLEELDCRTWLDQALTTVWATYHAKISGWLEGVLAGVLDGLVPLGPIDSFTFKTFQLGAAAPRVRRVVPSDPFVVVEVGGADAGGGFEARETLRTATKSKTLNPTWDGEVFTLTIADPAVDRVRISVFDYDLGGEPDPLGSAWLGGRLLRTWPAGASRPLRQAPPTDDAEAARGEVRLSPDAAVSILEEKKKRAVVEAASAALGLDGAALRSAGENGDAVDLYSGATVVVEILEARGLTAADDDGLSDPYAMAGGVGTAATVLRAANIFRSKANTPDRVSCLSAMGAARVDDSDDDDDDGTPKRRRA
ncbi:C2 domain-containing protein [Aureococcus anophagefferens]|nr:C2 domain-containing protein [Aureococcus anophagefferens]